MKKGTSLDFDSINRLYMEYFNERDTIKKGKLKNRIKQQVSPYDMLMYSIRFAIPFKAFKEIFILKDLFKTLAEMEKRGEDISAITRNVLLIDGKEDIDALNDVSFEGTETKAGLLNLRFQGSDLFKYGDVKKIGENFPRACVNFINIELLEEFIKKDQAYKGVPIIITIDNMGELPLDKLSVIESKFDVVGVRILDGKDIRNHRIEKRPISLREYKEIRTVIDEEIIKKLYVTEGANKTAIDGQLATQIFCLLIDRTKYDETFKQKKRQCLKEI